MRTAASLWTSFSREALDWVYPPKCALCGVLGEASPCAICESHMEPGDPDLVNDLEGPLSYRACVYAYKGRAKQAVTRLKYARSTSLGDFMAARVAERVRHLADVDDVIVPVPIHLTRRALRGFNQAEICALGNHGMEVRPDLLARIRPTRSQAGLPLKERERNLENAFQANPEVRDRNIVLIDDVVTSGHTAKECAKVLVEAGALSVGVVAFCGKLD